MYKFVKRTFDLLASIILFVIISPLFFLIMILVKIKLGSPVFFRQTRTGKNMKEFTIIKFRTMTDKRDSKGNILPDEDRITKFGKVLRASSLDELPELFSIIMGDMAVIGPRPLPPRYDDYYTERERKRFTVRGGLIPPEAIHNNMQPTWDEQLEYEALYAENLSFHYDIMLILAVFKGLFTRYKNNYGEYIRPGLDEERKLKEKAPQI